VFDENNPDDPCLNCRKRGTKCGKALPTQQPINYEHSQSSSTPPDSSDGSSTPPSGASSPREHSLIEVEFPPNHDPPVSKLLEGWRQLAARRENEFPRRSDVEIWQEIIPQFMPYVQKVEHSGTEHFGHRSRSEVSHVPTTYVPHPSHTPIPPDATYINPSTLQLELVSETSAYPPTYREHWGGEERPSSDSHEEYVLEDSQDSSVSYTVVPAFGNFYGPVFPVQDFPFPLAHPLPLPYPSDASRDVFGPFL